MQCPTNSRQNLRHSTDEEEEKKSLRKGLLAAERGGMACKAWLFGIGNW